jgi:hypothetical protein
MTVPGLASGIAAIDSGAMHTCAITTTGGALCWGGQSVRSRLPTTVVGFNNEQRQPLSIGIVGPGSVYSYPAGIACRGDCQESYFVDQVVTLSALPDPGYRLDSWSGACSGSTDTVTVSMEAAKTCTATFVSTAAPTTYTLSLSKSGNGTVTSSPAGIDCGATCSASFAANQTITLTAAPATGYSFGSWGGSCSGSAATTTVGMDAGKNCLANFVVSGGTGGGTGSGGESDGSGGAGGFTITFEKSVEGTVTSNPPGINCGTDGDVCSASFAANKAVTLFAQASNNYGFGGWAGDCKGKKSQLKIKKLKKSMTCTVKWAKAGIQVGGSEQ